MSELITLLTKLTDVFGPTGCEWPVREAIEKELRGVCDEMHTDNLGSLIAVVRGQGAGYDPECARRLMISAHMDEVGMMISKIDDDGFLSFPTVGGIDSRVMSGRPIKIFANDETLINGIIGSKAIHLQSPDERTKSFKVSDMYIDIGARDKAEAEATVSIGDFATFDSPAYMLGEYKLKAKAIDDRLGCAIMILVAKALRASAEDRDYDVYFSFGVREEIGISGTTSTAFAIAPDVALVLESTAVADIAGVGDASKVAIQGEGGALSLIDRSTIYDRDLFDFIVSLAKEKDIPVQTKKYVSGGNDASHIHKSRAGVFTAALSAPTRYLHSASCVADGRDMEAMLELTRELAFSFGKFDKRHKCEVK